MRGNGEIINTYGIENRTVTKMRGEDYDLKEFNEEAQVGMIRNFHVKTMSMLLSYKYC